MISDAVAQKHLGGRHIAQDIAVPRRLLDDIHDDDGLGSEGLAGGLVDLLLTVEAQGIPARGRIRRRDH